MEANESSESGFICDAPGPPGVFGVFEDDGNTGYLYLYEPGIREVFGHLHVYDRTADLTVAREDVRVLWSGDLAKVGVEIWGKMRGVIVLATGDSGRVWMENRDTPGIGDPAWLDGFSI